MRQRLSHSINSKQVLYVSDKIKLTQIGAVYTLNLLVFECAVDVHYGPTLQFSSVQN